MSMRVLVLGADGFIGARLLRALAATDWAEPVAAGRRATPADSGYAGRQIVRMRFDATDPPALAQALEQVDAAVNCVAGNAHTIEAGARALVGAATRCTKAPRLVQLSSMAVYGAVSGLVPESAPLRGLDPYAQAKISAEKEFASYGNAVLLRPGIVYGPHSRQWTERIARWLFARRLGDLGALGDGCCNLVHVDDVARAVLECLKLPGLEGQAFNLAMAAPPTWNEYFIRFARALGAVPVRRVGRRRLQIETKLLAPPLKIVEILASKVGLRRLRLPEPIPPSLLRLCQQEIRLDVARAEQLLLLRWTALGEGLEQAAQWWRGRTGS